MTGRFINPKLSAVILLLGLAALRLLINIITHKTIAGIHLGESKVQLQKARIQILTLLGTNLGHK